RDLLLPAHREVLRADGRRDQGPAGGRRACPRRGRLNRIPPARSVLRRGVGTAQCRAHAELPIPRASAALAQHSQLTREDDMDIALTDEDARAVEHVSTALRSAVPDGRLGVAFSGGVDSATLLALAARALGTERVVAVL